MTTFLYKSGGRISRYLIDYGTYPVAQLINNRLDEFWEEQYLTQRVEEVTYGTVGHAMSYGIGSKSKSIQNTSITGGDDQFASGGYFIVGDPGTSLGRFTNAWQSRTYNYYPGIVDYYTELDYGLIKDSKNTHIDCGSITVGVVNESVDHGHIWIETTQWAFLPDIKVISAVSWKATEAFVGDGRLWSWGEQSSPAVYGSITDGKVRISGTADVDFSPAIEGRGVAPLQGTSGIVFSPLVRGTGTLRKFTGTAYSLTINPDEKQMLFSFTGVLGEVRAANYYGSGYLKNFSNTEGDKSFAYVGSGSIRLFARKLYSPSDEKHTESYNPSSIVEWDSVDWGVIGGCTSVETISTSGDVTGVSTGCIIKINQGVTARVDTSYQIAANNNAASYFIDYGEVAHSHTTFENRGSILVTSNLMPFGDIKIDPTKGAGSIFKPNWVGRGTIKITGDAKLPLFASVLADGLFKIGGASVTNFALGTPGTGLFKIRSLTNTPRSRGHIGSGTLRKFTGTAESLTINPTEKQLLFSFTGEHQVKFGYGAYKGLGNIKNLAGGIETGTFDYVGTGSIITWNKLEEAITSSYNCSSIVPWVDLDYGLILDRANTTCVTDSGIKTSDVTAVSGCIKVEPGTTLTISENKTYTIPSQQTVPSITEDYGSVAKTTPITREYGWILGTVTHGMPSCVYGELDVSGSAAIQFVPNWVGSGLLILTGEARLPLFASHTTEGDFGPIYGEAITNFSLGAPGDGLYHIGGEGLSSIGRKEIGEGLFSTFSGSAESITWNPEETQMLFSFTGGYSNLEFTYGTFEGSGILWNFAGGDERGTFSYSGSGSLLTFNKLEEARTYWYNCSSIVEWQNLDYGLLVSAAQAPCVTDSGIKTSDVNAVSGCIKVAPGTTLALDVGSTYTIPSHLTQPVSFEDYGSVTKLAAPTKEYGWILGTVEHGMPSCVYGEIDIFGVAASKFQPSWTTRGSVRLLGASKTNFSLLHNGFGTLFEFSGASEVLSAAIEGRGLFRISSLTETPRARAYEGSGTLRKISGTAVSLTVNPEEKQMLFSFIGGITSEKHTEAYAGSGFLRNFASVYTTGTFDYASSGVIKLRSYTDESETHVYDLNLCYNPPQYDYGFLVSAAQATCVADSGIKTSNVTATSGCVKVEPGTTLAIASSNIYTIASNLTVPTSTEDYHNIIDLHRGTRDYGHILGSLSRTCPFGSIEFWNEATCAEVQVYTAPITGDSLRGPGITIDNEAIVTVPPQWNGYGVLDISKFSVGSITGFSLLHPGSGRMFTYSGSAESVRYSPDEEQLLFKINPGPLGRWDSYDWQPCWVTRGYIKGATGEAKTHYVPNVTTTGYLKSLSGGAEAIAYSPDLGEDNFYVCIDREGTITTTTVATSGCIKVVPGTTLEIGPGVYYQIPPTYQGSVAGIDDRSLGNIIGEATESFTTIAQTDEGVPPISFNNRGITTPVFFIPNYPGYGVIPVTGDARIYYTPHVIGEGVIWNYSGTAESITVNPDEKQMLFSFIGTRESEVISVTETGFGTAIFGGEVYTTASISEDGFGTVAVLGAGDTTRSRIKVGSGTLRKFAGAAESITVNPEEKQMLFSFIGEGAESRSIANTGSGRLFAFTGAAEAALVAWEGSGLYRVSGEAYIITSLLHIGSGTLKKFAGAAESLTVNPDERQLLFSFTGEGTERHTESYNGSGSLNVFGELTHPDIDYTPHITGSGTFNVLGDVGIRWVPNNVGEGTIFTIAGGAESITINPDEKQMLFSFTGESTESTLVREISKGGVLKLTGTSGDPLLTFAEQPFVQTKISGECRFTTHRNIVGTGSLYTISGAAESLTVNPEEEQILFSLTGESTNRTTSSYVGTGSLYTISGAAESISFNPDEQQMLFSFTGASTNSRTTREIGTGTLSTTGEAGVLVRFAYTGEGTISLSGDAHTTRTRDYVGFGTFRKLSGAAESLTFNPTERDMLFSFYGTRIAEIATISELSKGGTLVVGSTSGDPNLTFAEQPYVNIDVTGDSYDIRTRAYQGSGTLSNLHSADESLALAPYIGSGTARISGIAIVQVQLFQPASVQVWII